MRRVADAENHGVHGSSHKKGSGPSQAIWKVRHLRHRHNGRLRVPTPFCAKPVHGSFAPTSFYGGAADSERGPGERLLESPSTGNPLTLPVVTKKLLGHVAARPCAHAQP